MRRTVLLATATALIIALSGAPARCRTAPPPPTALPGWTVVLNEEFEDNGRGWPVRDDELAEIELDDGVYDFDHHRKGAEIRFLRPTTLLGLGDFRIETVLRRRSGDDGTFGFCFGGPGEVLYRFTIDAKGRALAERFGDKTETLAGPARLEEIRRGSDWNELRLDQRGGEWLFSVNGREAFRIPARPVQGGEVGGFLSGRLHVAYERFVVQESEVLPDAYATFDAFRAGLPVRHAVFSRDGARMATWSSVGPRRGVLALWDATRTELPLLAARGVDDPALEEDWMAHDAFALSPDGTRFATAVWTGKDKGEVVVGAYDWSAPRRRLRQWTVNRKGHRTMSCGLAFAPDGERCAACLRHAPEAPASIYEFDNRSSAPLAQIEAGPETFWKMLSWSPDGRYLAVLARMGDTACAPVYERAGGAWKRRGLIRGPNFAVGYAPLLFSTDSARTCSLLFTQPVINRLPGLEEEAVLESGSLTKAGAFGPDGTLAVFSPGTLRRFVPRKGGWRELRGVPAPEAVVALGHVDARSGWLVVDAKEGARFVPDITEPQVRALLALDEALEMIDAGFAEQGVASAARAVGQDPAQRALGLGSFYQWTLPRVAKGAAPAGAGAVALAQARAAEMAVAAGGPAVDADGDTVAAMYHGMFSYGLYAGLAGQYGLALLAAGEMERMGGAYATALNARVEEAASLPLLLRAVALAGQGRAKEAFDLLFGREFTAAQAQYVILLPDLFRPLYREPAKLAYVLGKEVKDLPKAAPFATRVLPYPDLSGAVLGPPERPALDASPAPATLGPSAAAPAAAGSAPAARPKQGAPSGAVILE
ncbi:MAG: hypothetical protein H0S85_12490 [Desulfovibrionaceae bacterium]|jgi:hypothetical protein|nr:hypothetical protein [Desulfovibrionaceae bacterium]